MLNPEFDRTQGIGASEAAAALGMSRYMTPLDLFLEKTNPAPRTDNKMTRRGRGLEDFVLDEYELKYGEVIRTASDTVVSEKYPFMFATPDAIRKDDGRVVDAKTVGFRMLREWGDEGTDDVPQEYLIQVMSQMIVKDAKIGDLAAYLAFDELRRYEINYDVEFAEMIILGLAKFKKRIENNEPPPPSSLEDITKLYPRSKLPGIEADEEALVNLQRLVQVRESIKPLEAEEERLKVEIQKFMGGHEAVLIEGRAAATFKSAADSESFDKARFAKEHPDLYAQYVTTKPGSRRFLLKDKVAA